MTGFSKSTMVINLLFALQVIVWLAAKKSLAVARLVKPWTKYTIQHALYATLVVDLYAKRHFTTLMGVFIARKITW